MQARQHRRAMPVGRPWQQQLSRILTSGVAPATPPAGNTAHPARTRRPIGHHVDHATATPGRGPEADCLAVRARLRGTGPHGNPGGLGRAGRRRAAEHPYASCRTGCRRRRRVFDSPRHRRAPARSHRPCRSRPGKQVGVRRARPHGRLRAGLRLTRQPVSAPALIPAMAMAVMNPASTRRIAYGAARLPPHEQASFSRQEEQEDDGIRTGGQSGGVGLPWTCTAR